MLTCAEATRAASETVMRLGYTIATVETARPGTPGKVVGRRDAGWSSGSPEAGALHTLTITITCSDAGSAFPRHLRRR
jgi:hypothetical protein